ncbi:uncharacterized protein OCT59_011763 [Rhizophagus irregularis]|uniref:Uncharacterized protein n=3 Tax=Rhizophagus irregularis TaxID=588596 RepID=U9V6Q9_RHIID|nr:hypothetical protein OCT59_011763 [Rhizophagus irregularis]GBC39406.1 hypothetical protein GLOIN_2v1667018 [Rhizophagus irregularis DAOM 181602=DAOM 197198]CAG8672786.1 18233_t:CDS:1 [Rhizophagus irregularis]
MNNYREIKKQNFYDSIFEFIIFRNRIKHHIIKRKTNGISNFSNFIIWNIVFFSFIPLASASIAPFVDIDYKSQEDLYDAILNTLFPILFVIFLNVSGNTGSIKNIVLPLLDDILYNMITWMIPLIVSFAYDDLMKIKLFSIANMFLHVICAVLAIIRAKRVEMAVNNDLLNFFRSIALVLIINPVLVIPIFWINIITHTSHTIDSTSIIFLTLFGICLISFVLLLTLILLLSFGNNIIEKEITKIICILCIICFYVPNILQTLFIALSWPINFYFVKACVFILILSLTRNVSYFTDRVPKDFLATSTTMTQYILSFSIAREMQNIFRGIQMSMEEMHEKQEEMHKIQKTMQAEIDEMQTTMQIKINEMQTTMQTKIDEMQTTMQTKIDEIQKSINENKNING